MRRRILNRNNLMARLLARRILARRLAARNRCSRRLSLNLRARIFLFIWRILLSKASFAFLANRRRLMFPIRFKRTTRRITRLTFLFTTLNLRIRLRILFLSFLVLAIRVLFLLILLTLLLVALISFLRLRRLAFLERPLPPIERK